MKIIDNRESKAIIDSPIAYIEHVDDNHAKAILYSGYSVHIDHDEFMRLTSVLQPRPCVSIKQEQTNVK